MWREVREDAVYELGQLRRLLAEFGPVIERSLAAPPSLPEQTSIAAVLHSFYAGVENIFKRIASGIDGHVPTGKRWHSDLLGEMARRTDSRPPVVNEALRGRLEEYLAFRHVFRGHYAFELTWTLMEPLVRGLGPLLTELELALDRFFTSAGPKPDQA